jgi:hypothetical protein
MTNKGAYMKSKNQSGFGLVPVLLLILILAVVGFGGYYVLSKNKSATVAKTNLVSAKPADKPDSQIETSTSANVGQGNTKTTSFFGSLSGKGGQLGVTYPATWRVVYSSKPFNEINLLDAYVKSDKGNYMNFYETTGLGGACPPNDVSFTLRHRIETNIPKVVFTDYTSADDQNGRGFALQDNNAAPNNSKVPSMNEGDTLIDTCQLFIYPSVSVGSGADIFVTLTNGPRGEAGAKQLSYEDLMADQELYSTVKSLSLK